MMRPERVKDDVEVIVPARAERDHRHVVLLEERQDRAGHPRLVALRERPGPRGLKWAPK